MHNINSRRVDLNLLVVFDTLYRQRNVTKAGEEMHMSQSAVSHALNRLRDILDDPLFVRAAKGLIPTDYADRIAPRLMEALALVHETIIEEKAFDPKIATIDVNIGVSQMDPLVFLPSLYTHLKKEAPKMNLRVHPVMPEQCTEALDSKSIDVIFDFEGARVNQLPDRILSTPLFEDDLVVISDKNNTKFEKDAKLEDYASAPHLVLASGKLKSTWIDDLLAEHNLKRRIGLIAPNPHAIKQVIPNSDLICTVARSLAIPFVDQEEFNICTAPFSWQEPHRYVQLWHAGSRNDLAQQWLRSTFQTVWQDVILLHNFNKV